MWNLWTTPSDSLIGLLFLLAVLATLGLVRLAETLKELRS
ncbi:hypothetical protein JCM14124_21750 [Humidesulfovibrio idahonensis]